MAATEPRDTSKDVYSLQEVATVVYIDSAYRLPGGGKTPLKHVAQRVANKMERLMLGMDD